MILLLASVFLVLGGVQVGAKMLTLPEFGNLLDEHTYNWLTALTIIAGGLTIFLGNTAKSRV